MTIHRNFLVAAVSFLLGFTNFDLPAEAGKLEAYDKDWFENFATRYDLTKTTLPITLGAIRLGDVALLFHPAELYSVYGLLIQRDSPLPHTLVVGYADGYIGYVPDPKAYASERTLATGNCHCSGWTSCGLARNRLPISKISPRVPR